MKDETPNDEQAANSIKADVMGVRWLRAVASFI